MRGLNPLNFPCVAPQRYKNFVETALLLPKTNDGPIGFCPLCLDEKQRAPQTIDPSRRTVWGSINRLPHLLPEFNLGFHCLLKTRLGLFNTCASFENRRNTVLSQEFSHRVEVLLLFLDLALHL